MTASPRNRLGAATPLGFPAKRNAAVALSVLNLVNGRYWHSILCHDLAQYNSGMTQ